MHGSAGRGRSKTFYSKGTSLYETLPPAQGNEMDMAKNVCSQVTEPAFLSPAQPARRSVIRGRNQAQGSCLRASVCEPALRLADAGPASVPTDPTRPATLTSTRTCYRATPQVHLPSRPGRSAAGRARTGRRSVSAISVRKGGSSAGPLPHSHSHGHRRLGRSIKVRERTRQVLRLFTFKSLNL